MPGVGNKASFPHKCIFCSQSHKSILLIIFLLSVPISSSVLAISNSKNKTVLYSRSVQGLQDLIYADLQIAKLLTEHVHKFPYQSYLRGASEIYLEDLYRGSGIESRNTANFTFPQAVSISTNPIAVYRAIRRMVKLLPDLDWHAKDSRSFEFPGDEASLQLHRGMPDGTDLNLAMDGILILHFNYDFDLKSFSNGNISGKLTKARLDAVHCYEIGVYASTIVKFYAQAVNWLELALIKLTIDGDQTIDKSIVATAFMSAIKQHDDAFPTIDDGNFEEAFEFNFTFFDGALEAMLTDGTFSKRKTRRSIEYETFKGKLDLNNGFSSNFWGVCGGDNYQSAEEKSELFCWLEFKANEYFLIGPLKMEFLARNPDVVQIYNFIGGEAMDEIKRKSEANLNPSLYFDDDEDSSESQSFAMEVRTSESAWLSLKHEKSDKLLISVTKSVSHLTGLDAVGAGEPLQVAAYTPAGHYMPHLDANIPMEARESTGDRIATFMIYMSDVEAGGLTAFPNLGVAANPIKGSAVFWYNILPSEEADKWTLHGACPVLMGHKYVANKWIRYNGHFLTHKCSKNPQDRYQIAVNNKYLPLAIRTNRSNLEPPELESKTYQKSGDSSVYRSVPGLKAFAEVEQTIYKLMKSSYLKANGNVSFSRETEFDKNFKVNHLCVQNYLKDFEDSSGKLLNGNVVTKYYAEHIENNRAVLPSEKISWNPLAVYRMIWRSQKFLRKWVNESAEDNNMVLGRSYQNAIKALKEIFKNTNVPDTIDLREAQSALRSLQYVYDLDARDMASGVIIVNGSPSLTVNTGVRLSALQCYEIGLEGISEKMFTLGIEWLEAAIFLITINQDNSVELEAVRTALQKAKKIHDEAHEISEEWDPMFYANRFNTFNEVGDGINEAVLGRRRLTRKTSLYDYFRFNEGTSFAEINYNGVCSGKSHQTPKERSKLFCWYETEIHPYWKINPLKAEFQSLYPKLEIVQYHDLLTDEVMDSLKEAVMSQLVTSKAGGHLDAQGFQSNIRVRSSVNGWLKERDNEYALKVSKLIERVTGLTVQKNLIDDLQIAAYTPGAQYSIHKDVRSEVDPESSSGFRLATFMFYFSDVQSGGYTAFSHAGAKVAPKKGSAVFWYNLFSSGEPMDNTWHGACPVIFGEKWVANMWISYENQRKHACHSDSGTPDEILVNGESKYDFWQM